MTTTTPTSPGGLLARARWSKPENVARRVDRLVSALAALPDTLTPEQRERLMAAIPSPAEDEGVAA